MTNWPPAERSQHNAKIGADNNRLPREQTDRQCARERSNTRMLVRSG